MTTREKSEEMLDAEAAAWFTTMHSGEVDQRTRERFEAWLHGDRAHKIAYRMYEQVYRDLDFVAVKSGIEFDQALPRRPRQFAWGWRRTALVAVLVVAILVGVNISSPRFASREIASSDYATRKAEIRKVVLQDGTLMTLGAKSEVVMDFSPMARKVTLLEGEVFFEVTRDHSRPFLVAVQDTLIRAVGTQFDVKRSADIVHVSVLEGAVEVMKPDDIVDTSEEVKTDNLKKQVLSAGERISVARHVALPRADRVEQAKPGSWREGQLVYEDASLAEIVADLNRYHDLPIRIATSDVGDLRSTLAFQTAQIEQAFAALEAVHPIDVDEQSSGEIVIRRKSP